MTFRGEKGVTLVEAMVSAVIIAVILMMLTSLGTQLIQSQGRTSSQTDITSLSDILVQVLRSSTSCSQSIGYANVATTSPTVYYNRFEYASASPRPLKIKLNSQTTVEDDWVFQKVKISKLEIISNGPPKALMYDYDGNHIITPSEFSQCALQAATGSTSVGDCRLQASPAPILDENDFTNRDKAQPYLLYESNLSTAVFPAQALDCNGDLKVTPLEMFVAIGQTTVSPAPNPAPCPQQFGTPTATLASNISASAQTLLNNQTPPNPNQAIAANFPAKVIAEIKSADPAKPDIIRKVELDLIIVVRVDSNSGTNQGAILACAQ